MDACISRRSGGTNVSGSREMQCYASLWFNSCPRDPLTSYVKRVVAVEGDFIRQVTLHIINECYLFDGDNQAKEP